MAAGSPTNLYDICETAYKSVKGQILYEGFHTIMIAIVLFLMFLKLFDEYQKQLQGSPRMDWGAFFRQTWIFVVVCVFAACVGDIFNMIESILTEMQTDLVKSFNFSRDDAVMGQIKAMARELIDSVGVSTLLTLDILALVQSITAWIVLAILIPVYGYIYFFYLASRTMWLLMLDFIAPIALVTMLHENTRTYFYTWLKNMILCYLLLPMFLLADTFSNEITYALVETSTAGLDAHAAADAKLYFSMVILVAGLWIKLKMFSVVRQKTMQLI